MQLLDLHVKYGNIEVLHGINLRVGEGEIVTILGANGAGKSTTLLTISGLVKTVAGSHPVGPGRRSINCPLIASSSCGIAQVPEGRRIFGTLTVQENLNLGAFICS